VKPVDRSGRRDPPRPSGPQRVCVSSGEAEVPGSDRAKRKPVNAGVPTTLSKERTVIPPASADEMEGVLAGKSSRLRPADLNR
jgi:hypothetical protein